MAAEAVSDAPLTKSHSTGRRRYGHPALNGVLPQPWLPLKKGQTLVNRGTAISNGIDQSEAVVLTLRKRYSTIRKGARKRTVSQATAPDHLGTDAREGYSDADSTTRNPWSDVRTDGDQRPSQTERRVNRRLSFDDASGVIILPEDANWLMENIGSDSDEDYGHDSQSSSVHEHGTSSPTPGDGAGPSNSSPQATTAALSPTKKRHGTYFHHPERRRQTIPGAFPRS